MQFFLRGLFQFEYCIVIFVVVYIFFSCSHLHSMQLNGRGEALRGSQTLSRERIQNLCTFSAMLLDIHPVFISLPFSPNGDPKQLILFSPPLFYPHKSSVGKVRLRLFDLASRSPSKLSGSEPGSLNPTWPDSSLLFCSAILIAFLGIFYLLLCSSILPACMKYKKITTL